MRIGALYQHCFETRPWATLIVTNGTLTVVADALAQTFDRAQEKKEAEKQLIKTEPQPASWDWHRSARFLAFGSGVAPALAEWNKFLEHNFHIRSATGRMLWGGLARRVLTDQLLLYVVPLTQRASLAGRVCRVDGLHGRSPHLVGDRGKVQGRTSQNSPRSIGRRSRPTGPSGRCSKCSTLACFLCGTCTD